MASVKALLFTSKTLKNGEHPIMLRVIENRKAKYISLGYSAKAEHWDFKQERPNKKHPHKLELDLIIGKRIQEVLQVQLESELSDRIASPSELLEAISNRKKTSSFLEYGFAYCQQLKSQGRVSTASSYKESLNRLIKLTGNKELSFRQITTSLLYQFESALLAAGVSENSISVYMRSLRAIYNRGISEGLAREADYPFKSYKVSKLDNRTVKRAITKEQVQQLASADLEPNSRLDFARKVFLFSYYCRGINFRDIALLKKENWKEDRIVYRRSKTGQTFNIGLLPPATAILEEMSQVPNSGGYLFPILNEFHDTPTRIADRLKRVMRLINQDLKELAAQENIPVNLTTYVARHTYATVLKRAGVSTSVISESMGHATEQITQTYLDSFENKVLDEADLALL